MANTENSKNPKVSKLPLPISDSPLVIDLPDGQKLVVGQMSKGTVIEEISEKAAKSECAKKSRAKKATKGNKKRKGSR